MINFKKIIFRCISTIIQIFEQNLFNFYRSFSKVRVFDCFIFHNEIDLLKLRLDYLENIVDVFVIVEAKLTFTNNIKEKYFAESIIKKLPNELRKKIRYVQLKPSDFPQKIKNDPWEMETFIRNSILLGLDDLKKYDFLWLSDIDEIPNKEKVYKLGRLSMFFSYYKINLLKNYFWTKSKAMLGKHIINSTPQFIRMKKWQYTLPIYNGGWHFSFLMSKEKIREKVKSFAHTECDKEEFISLENIEKAIKTKKDLFGRSDEDLTLKTNLSFLPEIIQSNLEFYKDLIEF